MTKIILIILLAMVSQEIYAEQCPMKPAMLDYGRVAKSSQVKSIVVDKSRLTLTALLKNGHSLRLVHSGCNHSGATATLWLDSDVSMDDRDSWLKEAVRMVDLAFAPSVARDIVKSINAGKFSTQLDRTRTVFSGSVSSFMTYSIVVSSAESGMLLTVSYVLG